MPSHLQYRAAGRLVLRGQLGEERAKGSVVDDVVGAPVSDERPQVRRHRLVCKADRVLFRFVAERHGPECRVQRRECRRDSTETKVHAAGGAGAAWPSLSAT